MITYFGANQYTANREVQYDMGLNVSINASLFLPSPLQSGALDLLKELRSVPMTLELLQVSLLIPTEGLSSTQAALKP